VCVNKSAVMIPPKLPVLLLSKTVLIPLGYYSTEHLTLVLVLVLMSCVSLHTCCVALKPASHPPMMRTSAHSCVSVEAHNGRLGCP